MIRDTQDDTREIQLFEDEAHSANLFLALGTQWSRHAMTGHHLGLDYSAIAPTAAMLEIPVGPARFHDLRAMEGAALSQFARAVRT